MQQSVDIPIGSVVAWHQNLVGKNSPLLLPKGWLRCDGSEVTRIRFPTLFESIGATEDKITLPNLNDKTKVPFIGTEGGGAFLRGGTVSGDQQPVSIISYTRNKQGNLTSDVGLPLVKDFDGEIVDGFTNEPGYLINDVSIRNPGAVSLNGVSIRPVNMVVVWIIRVE